MEENERKQLGTWIAEHFCGYGGSAIDYSDYTSPIGCISVKNEIERRRGAWSISYYCRVKEDGNDPFFCSVWLPNGIPTEVWAASEGEAVCIAVKAALEDGGSDEGTH